MKINSALMLGVIISLLLFQILQRQTNIASVEERAEPATPSSKSNDILTSLNYPQYSNIKKNISEDEVSYSGSIKADMAKIEGELKESNAIEHLNRNLATTTERDLIYGQLRALDQLRTREIEQDLAKIEKEIAQLELEIPSRQAFYEMRQ